ncbi:MAG TPA: hypothetical protein PKC76_19415 [Saprospiraceae bacterium]|nr:hypothetical protein [Saprospiraceae bacterium]HMP26306.1 hypothetical protein [Saprospiraceae bacterium]
MDIQAEKVGIIEQVVKIQDERLLIAIKSLLEFGLQHTLPAPDPDFWAALNAQQRARVEASIHQLENGEGVSHESVMQQLRQKYQS